MSGKIEHYLFKTLVGKKYCVRLLFAFLTLANVVHALELAYIKTMERSAKHW
jgi:hypothetical protein